ncbi:MAG TPA: PAS domain-containing protein [Pirellulales bacterium]|nr:PAS domain-containing protein [Pirellulales bacterium]
MLDRMTDNDARNPERDIGSPPDAEAMLAALAAHDDLTILAVDRKGNISYGNNGQSARSGCPGGNLYALLSSADHPRCHDALARCCELGQSDCFETHWLDGTIRSVRVVPLASQQEKTALVIARDVTDVVRVQEALSESEQRFRQLAENVREVFWLLNPIDRRLLYVTNAYERIWGRSAKEFYQENRGWFDAVHVDDSDRVKRSFDAALESGSFQAEYRIVRPDGAVRWIRDRAYISRGANGQAARVAGIAEDITEQRNVEDSLRMERKLLKRLLDLQERERHLLACEIHDGFIQDLVGAKMLVESIRPRLSPEHSCLMARLETIECALRKAIGEGRRMVSNLRPMVIDDKGILAAIEYLINERQAEAGPHMTFSHDVRFSRLPPLLEGTLFRIVQESLTNARRHSQASEVHVELAQVDERVVLTIVDDGVGFNRAEVPEGRFGLRGLIERARLFGGRADVHSEPGCGTRVWVDLPISKSGISL